MTLQIETIGAAVPSPPSARVDSVDHATMRESIAQKTQAVMAHVPKLKDEIKININDQLSIIHTFHDGWAFGLNITTGKRGVFPMMCYQPDLPRLSNTSIKTVESQLKLKETREIETPSSWMPSIKALSMEEHNTQSTGRMRTMLTVLVCLVLLTTALAVGLAKSWDQ
ncbi:hypothetical protein EDD86DRAFT_210989 [Gorgonomyces haynaldii]|nr:hypothetical protein EDD86DRAFT_210989 [Gorgonomyces haynaldii]